MFIQALNRNLNLQRFNVIYVCGNYSSILSSLDRRFEALDVRRAFTVFQLMTVLEQNHHTIVIIEHDPLLYEDAQEMAEYVSQAMREASNEAAVLLYAPGADPYFEELVKNADRVFYFDEGPRAEARVVAKAIPRLEESDDAGSFLIIQ
jgi:DNA polymerase I